MNIYVWMIYCHWVAVWCEKSFKFVVHWRYEIRDLHRSIRRQRHMCIIDSPSPRHLNRHPNQAPISRQNAKTTRGPSDFITLPVDNSMMHACHFIRFWLVLAWLSCYCYVFYILHGQPPCSKSWKIERIHTWKNISMSALVLLIRDESKTCWSLQDFLFKHIHLTNTRQLKDKILHHLLTTVSNKD